MTTPNEARELIYARFRAQTTLDAAHYTFDNETYQAPTWPAGQNPTAADCWVRLTVRHTGASQDTLGEKGHRNWRRYGLIIMQVFVPADLGVKAGDDLAQACLTMFEGEELAASFNVYAGTPMEKPQDGRWLPLTVELPFDYYQTS